jgi:hypothetical protein
VSLLIDGEEDRTLRAVLVGILLEGGTLVCLLTLGVGGDPYPSGPDVGTFIDPARWDGADFFMADNNNSIHVVGSTAERIHKLRFFERCPRVGWAGAHSL